MKSSDFSYELPRSAIAQHPISPRDAARLLVVDGLRDHVFSDLPELLEPGDVLVVNRTRVRASRLIGNRATGGAVEVLLLRPHVRNTWRALVRPAKKLSVGETIRFGQLSVTIVEHLGEGVANVSVESTDGTVDDAIAEAGVMPLPPYITEPLGEAGDYQTVYAQELGSAAAPTAGLHFTPELLEALASQGIDSATVVLEVGLDTFRPMTTEHVEDHQIHSERIVVEQEAVDAITAAKNAGGRVIAVGTTVVRALESAARSGMLEPFDGDTDLYITPGYECKVVDGLITNFHLPGTTLLVMIAALFGETWREAYAAALERDYRFLSFGDAILGWVK